MLRLQEGNGEEQTAAQASGQLQTDYSPATPLKALLSLGRSSDASVFSLSS